MSRLKRATASGAGSGHLDDPADANPALVDVLQSRLCPQHPCDVAPMADFLIRYNKRNLALSLELAGNLAMKGLLVGLLLLFESLLLRRRLFL